MKKLLNFFLIICSLSLFSQIKVPADFKFTTPFYEAVNHYVVFSPKPEDRQLMLGVPYIDPSAGYSYRFFGNISIEKDKLVFSPSDENSSITSRWQNLDLKVAVLPLDRIKELKLKDFPEFLKNYQTDMLDRDYSVEIASFQNGAGYSNLALPTLEKLRQENYQSQKFYFELAFAYNALDQSAKAEEVIKEAEKNNFKDEYLIKEMHYALLHQNKLLAAADYLQANFKNFKSKQYQSESILNQIITFNNQKDKINTEKWIKIYKTEIGEDQYEAHVDHIESQLKSEK